MDISITPLEEIKTKKVSFNIEVQALEVVDDLTNLLKSNRTTVLMGIIGLGIPSYMNSLKSSWERLKKSNPDKKTKIEGFLKELSKIEARNIKRSY